MPRGRPRKKLLTQIDQARDERRQLCEASFEAFIELTQPDRVLGNIHREVLSWLSSEASGRHLLLLLPRDHGKSWAAGMYAAWEITRNPAIRILYISSTSNLAVKQNKFIKDVLTSDTYRLYWPQMVHPEEAKREKWTEREISVDHPLRKKEFIRDPTLFTAGLTTNIVGMHCDLAIMDDVVVAKNAYQIEQREKAAEQYAALSSIMSVNAKEIVVGTRYHPNDLYADLITKEERYEDDMGNYIKSIPFFNVKQYPVESAGDGTGQFLWPRQQRSDGKWFGFDAKILAEKKQQYGTSVQFRAQYYNDPHDVTSAPIKRDQFQYYNRDKLFHKSGRWYFGGKPLNVAASIDFAYSLSEKGDWSSIVTIGADGEGNYYILDIDRFKTKRVSEYFNKILKMYEKWGFRKVRAEVTAAQTVIVQDLKENYIRPMGLSLIIDEYKPSRWQGSKEERILATLEPKYANGQMWHYMGGLCQTLEEELIFANPPHDDIKDALASAVDLVLQPVNIMRFRKEREKPTEYHSRWGGVA
jgi:phage terminase large subunit-like protein